MPTKVIVTGTVSVSPVDLEAFNVDLQRLASTTRRRKGNLAYDVAILDAASGRLLVAERWDDAASLAAHVRCRDTASFVACWRDRMEGEVRRYDVCDEGSVSDG